MSFSDTEGALIHCSHVIHKDANLRFVAAALDIPDYEFDEIQRNYKDPQGQALQLFKSVMKARGEEYIKEKLLYVLKNAGINQEAVDKWV